MGADICNIETEDHVLTSGRTLVNKSQAVYSLTVYHYKIFK